MSFNGTIIGRPLKEEAIYLSATEAGKLFRGDLAYIFKKTALVKNPFPEIHGEKFVPELYIWNKISDSGNIIFFPRKAIYFCEYQQDGYSKNFMVNLKKNPRGFQLFYEDQFRREKSPLLRIKYAIRVIQCLYFRAKIREKSS